MLKDKVAIITGATSGIGARIASFFVGEGAIVVGAGRREAEGVEVARQAGMTFIRADVSVEEDVRALVDQTLAKFGRLDCMINNAGVSAAAVSGIADLDLADFDRVMDINIRGVAICLKYAARAMIPNGAGSIINISSISGSRAALPSHPYSASKAAVLAITRTTASELGEKGIRVNAISPGGIVTEIYSKSLGPDQEKGEKAAAAVRRLFSNVQPIRRAGEVDDIARAAAFLASDMSSFVNGIDLIVDGGLTCSRFGWTEGLEFRAKVREQIQNAVADE
jgi:NAD(P)-dependent dehydrogenase (short-subunit alcohol dehydrogenase family)